MRIRIAGGVLAASVTALPTLAEAQERRGTQTPSSSRVTIVRSSGMARDANDPDERRRPGRSPRPLTYAQINQLLGPLGLALASQAGPWRLTVSQRSAGGGRFRLSFWNVDKVESMTNETHMKPFSRVYLRLRALAPNEYYVLQCTVSSENPNPKFHLFGPGDSHSVIDGNNIVGVYHAPDTQDALFYIMQVSQGHEWSFSSCDISPLASPQTPR